MPIAPELLWRAFLVWLVIAGAEVGQGILRIRFLNRRVGDRRARQIGVGTGSVLILLIAWATAPWVGAGSTSERVMVGGLWLILMLAFDLAFGRWVFHVSWQRIARDFDVRQGGLLGLGMLVLLFAPLLVALPV